jgi:glycosyltransferase involved in cell wall biosynthesis
MKKKIGILNLTQIYGGGEKFIEDVFFPLAEDFDIYYLLKNKYLYDKCEENKKLFIKNNRFNALEEINIFLAENNIDTLILNGNGSIYMAPFIKCKEKIAYKHTGWQSVEGLMKKFIYFNAINVSYLFCRKIVIVSKSIMPLRIWKKKVFVIYNGVKIPVLPHKRFTNEVPNVIFVGRIYKEKGVFELLEVLNDLAAKFSFKMKFVGDGDSLEDFKLLAKKNNLEGIINFCGFCENVDEHLLQSDILVLPSYYEAFGLATAEGMSHGLAVAVSNNGGGKELIVHGKNGLLFNPHVKKDIYDSLKVLIESEAYRIELGNNARQTIIDKFSINNTIEQLKQLLK